MNPSGGRGSCSRRAGEIPDDEQLPPKTAALWRGALKWVMSLSVGPKSGFPGPPRWRLPQAESGDQRRSPGAAAEGLFSL